MSYPSLFEFRKACKYEPCLNDWPDSWYYANFTVDPIVSDATVNYTMEAQMWWKRGQDIGCKTFTLEVLKKPILVLEYFNFCHSFIV